jgi:hypothetical protein
MALMSAELERLIEEEHQKNLQIQNKEILVKEKPCGHLRIIEELEKELDKLTADIGKVRAKTEQFSTRKKDQELSSVKGKISQADAELRKLKKKSGFSEQNKQTELYAKIKNSEQTSKEMAQEIKLLKRLQHHTGNRLVDLDSELQYPEKIK